MRVTSPASMTGIGVCPGRAAGPVALMGPRPRLPADRPAVTDPDSEVLAAIAALTQTAEELEARAAASSMPASAEVLEATAMIARDPSLEEAVRSAIAKGEPAAWAVDRAIEAFRAMLLDLGGYMAERVSDLDDVRDRTVARLLGVPMPVTTLQGQDALLSIVQMPAGVPVGTLAIGKPGAINAGLLAVSILSNSRPDLRTRLRTYRQEQTEKVRREQLP